MWDGLDARLSVDEDVVVHVHADRVDFSVQETDVPVVEAILAGLTFNHRRLFEKVVNEDLALCIVDKPLESVA